MARQGHSGQSPPIGEWEPCFSANQRLPLCKGNMHRDLHEIETAAAAAAAGTTVNLELTSGR